MTAIQLRATTPALINCAVVAAPLWAAVSLVQAAVRPGFDLVKYPLSMLSTGPDGWIQVLNFLVAGVLTVIGGVGLRRVLTGWAPRLLTVNGVGMFAAGVFSMDPPEVTTLSWHSYGHMAAGTVAFASLIAACYVVARKLDRRRDKVGSYVAGTALLVGDLWAMGGGAGGSLTLAVGAITAMLWMASVAARYAR
ncbi:hypothetical protein GCM10029964_009170 [Kibdelosporangium lantanae]